MTKHNLNGWKRGSTPLQVTNNKIKQKYENYITKNR